MAHFLLIFLCRCKHVSKMYFEMYAVWVWGLKNFVRSRSIGYTIVTFIMTEPFMAFFI